MGFGEAISRYFKNYVNFQGRARRAEYWWPQLLGVIVSVVLLTLTFALSAGSAESGEVNPIAGIPYLLLVLFGLATFLPGLSVLARRLHDRDQSAWMILLALIPLIGGIVLLVFCCLSGTVGPNKYGPDPKGAPAPGTFA